MVENQETEREPEEVETTQYPWYIKELKKLSLGRRFKILVFVGISIFALWVMWTWFGWYFLLGLLPAPAWYFWALRQIDRESYTLIEVRLRGDKVNGKTISDTQTNIYQIPPDIWKDIKMKGNPYTVGHRLYICEYFEETEEGENIIHFSEDPRLSNLTFFTKVRLWLDLKARLPTIEQELAIYKYSLEETATKKAVEMLQTMGVIQASSELGLPIKRKILRHGREYHE